MTSKELERQCQAVASALGAEAGSDRYFRGRVDGTPFLMKVISDNPPAYLIKLRMIAPHNLESKWPATLSGHYASANIGCEIEDDYIFLWIRDSSSLDTADIVSLVRECIDHYTDYFPQASGYCFDCRESGNASVIQSGLSVSSICGTCLDKRAKERNSEEARLNKSSGSFALLIPLAITLSAVGWATFWWLCDAAFTAANAERIWAPTIVLALVVLAVGFGLGWPVGKLLHRSGLVKWLPPAVLSIAVAALTLILGELLFASYIVFRAVGAFDPGMVFQNALSIAFRGDFLYAMLKMMFAIAFATVVFQVAKPKRVKIPLSTDGGNLRLKSSD